ncbi:MAG: terminase large subunit [Bacilli bacterium]|nr:terminase large subunit [Bacilli bacterium]
MNYILTYYNLIVSGKIEVSKKVKKQYEMIINDLNNPNKYHFDIDKATRPITFIEKFCKHSKGQWAGKPVVLDLWQKAIIQTIFGFVDDKGFRRYRECFIVVARKNGKSTLLSAIGLYMLFADHEGGAQICCVASKKDQAKIVFEEAKNMVSQSKLLQKHIRKRKSDLYVDLTFSTFEPLASDSNTLDGLNMHCGILDEVHAWKDRNIYDVSKQSMGARQQPLLVSISTAGFIRENIYDSLYELSEDILNGIKKDERFLSFIYELDSRSEWTVQKKWIKANPGLGTIKGIDYLKEQVKRARNDKNYLPTLLTKDFNIRETGVGSWLTFETVENKEVFKLEDLRNCYGIGGVDLSSVGDLTCASCLIRKDTKLFLSQMYFIPEERAEQHEREDKVPYKIWKEQGYIRFCSGNMVNFSDVTAWFNELRDKYNIYTVWVGYDQWGANQWADEMKQNGYVLEPVIQGARTMSTPMKILASDLADKKVNYNNNPILKWCLTNTQVEVDKNDNIRPVKGKNSKQRIDGAVSLIDSYVVYQRHYEDYLNM